MELMAAWEAVSLWFANCSSWQLHMSSFKRPEAFQSQYPQACAPATIEPSPPNQLAPLLFLDLSIPRVPPVQRSSERLASYVVLRKPTRNDELASELNTVNDAVGAKAR